jgi:hypothetical protein
MSYRELPIPIRSVTFDGVGTIGTSDVVVKILDWASEHPTFMPPYRR